ncbi:winged helix-turn-helix transcriptional regulator [Clostridium uliginosum]|uniref:DNA-binding transcriptional regulator, HxlR family n=1 Tax=Clostridium uliginosum TaxID=119641 RepID=A0A1I1N5W2_9CLOT|nr:helix-turn-helix domain-containing protein [Clostridium uliginosum]SFC90888.1 DNA-binding transcriptional regulator, HxlR family [Clostridium uliginosum]
MKIRSEYTCPLELIHDLIKGKWKPIILWQLRLGNTSPSNLEKDIQGITQKMLLEQLKELMEFEFVGKKVYDGYPLRVEYFLTENKGKQILKAVKIMQEFGKDFMLEKGMQDMLKKKGVILE